MPSANPKLEKQASAEAVEPIRQAIIVIEHRIRNLEKRKGRLDSYRTIVKNGGELNSDQKVAVEKYDEVQQSLEITKEMHKQVVGIANDAAKQAKKIARKEASERMQRDIAKVKEVLLVQEYLANLGDKVSREDFLSGTNGAIKLSEEDLKCLDDIHEELDIKHHSESNAPLMQQAQKVAEHLVAIIEGKQREVVGTTYNKIKEILSLITQSGYFDQVAEVEVPVEEITEAVEEVHINNVAPEEHVSESYVNERHIPPSETLLPMPNFPVQTSLSTSGTTSAANQMSNITPQSMPNMTSVAQVETSFFTNSVYVSPSQSQQQAQSPPQQPQPSLQSSPQPPRINDVIGTPNFSFLQESELDTTEYTMNAPQSQVQTVVSHMAMPVNAPIPTQTFTNQSFAAVPVSQVMFQSHTPADMSHITSFNGSENQPPPPIPMPASHQSMQFTTPHPVYQHEPSQNPAYESMTHHQETSILMAETKVEVMHDHVGADNDMGQITESTDWGQMNDGVGDWSQTGSSQNAQDTQLQNSQQAWGDQQRSSYRGRGGRRGNGSNGYGNRGRGSGGYQQNGRGGSGGGNPYYRNESTNYQQNGFQRNWSNNDGTTPGSVSSGYNSGFKRGGGSGGSSGPRGVSRQDRGGMSGGGRGQYRGGQRGANQRNFAPRGKIQA